MQNKHQNVLLVVGVPTFGEGGVKPVGTKSQVSPNLLQCVSHHCARVFSPCFLIWGCPHITSAERGVWQMLTFADEGGRGGQPKADHC